MKDHLTLVVLDLNTDEELLIFGPYEFLPGSCLTFDGAHVEVPFNVEPTCVRIVNAPAADSEGK